LTKVDFFSIRHGSQVLFPFPVSHAAAGRTDRGWAHFFVCRQIAFKRGKRESTDKKENLIFLLYEEIQSGAVAKWKGFLIYEEMCKNFPIYEEDVSHI
jgi:hypothetical protein